MTQLKDIAQIRSGYMFRRGIEEMLGGKYPVVQIKDVTGDGFLKAEDLVRTDIDNLKAEHLVRKGDVLFAARGARKESIAVQDAPLNAVMSYQVFALQPSSGVLPEFLSWYMNQKPAQRYIEENSTGSYVTLISKRTLEHMPVAVPPMETQRRIVEIHKLFEREKSLAREIEERRGELIEATLLRLIEVESHTGQTKLW